MAAHPTETLDFGLNFADGRGMLGLRGRPVVDPLSLERLELEIPHLRFPFDMAGGAARFRTRRCLLRQARLSIDEERLGRWLRARKLEAYGIADLAVRVAEGELVVAFTARVGERAAEATARARLEAAGPRAVRVVLGDVRVYGVLPVPAPLWGLAILAGASAGARGDDGDHGTPRLEGVGALVGDPLKLALWRALPASGWRLPSLQAVRVRAVRVGGGRIEVDYGDAETGAVSASPPACPEGEEALARNDLEGARRAFRAALDGGERPELARRLAELHAASPLHWDEAAELAERALGRGPAPWAELLLAGLDGERGRFAEAGERYARLAAEAERASAPEDKLAALERAGEMLERAGDVRATAQWERLLAAHAVNGPASARSPAAVLRATERLAARYRDEGRFAELAKLERRRIALAAEPEEQARGHLRLGLLWLDRLGEPPRARDELERAVKIAPSPDALGALARAHAALGDRARALAAYDRQAQALSGDASAAAQVKVRAARLAAEGGDDAAALHRLGEALALDDRCVEARCEEARLHVRAGRAAEAERAFERATAALADEAGRDPTLERELLLEWAALPRGRGDYARARKLLGRAAELGDDRRVLEALAEAAELDGRSDEAERALGRLAALGDERAALKRARALLKLGRAGEARALAAAAGSVEGLRLAAEAAAAMGDGAERLAALEKLLAALPEAAAAERAEVHAQLGRIAAQGGDLDEAARHLAQAGDSREALAARCEVLEKKGDVAALAEALEQWADHSADDPAECARALERLGLARRQLDQIDRAAEAFRAAVALDPAREQALLGLADAGWKLRRWDDARAGWEPVFRRAGETPELSRVQLALRLGVVAERQGDLGAARDFYRAALERGASGGDAVRAHEALVALLEGRGDSEEAVRAMLDAADDPHTGESESTRAGRLVAAAGLLRRLPGRADEAHAIYERALAADPLHLGALDALEAMATQAGDAERAAKVLERKVDAMRSRPADQKAILARLAEIYSDRLGRPDSAQAAHRRALTIDAQYRPSLMALAQAARVAADPEEERELLERLALLPVDAIEPEVDVEARARLATLLVDEGRTADAEREAKRVLELAPRHPRALEILDDLFTREGRLRELEPVLQRRAEAEVGFERALGINYRRAALLEQLARPSEAVAAYEQIVRMRPSSAAAWERLAALHRDAGAWGELCGVLSRIAERRAAEGELGEASAIFVEMAHLAHDRLADGGRAAKLLERALELDPRSTLAVDGLLALARASGDVVAEDALLGRRAELEEDAGRRDAIKVERARLRRDRLDADGALELLADIPMARASDEALRLRVEIAEGRGAWSEAALVLEQLAARARQAGDGDGERHALRHLARIAWEELHHGRAAEGLYRRALELDPDDVAAATALVEVERERSDSAAELEALERLLRALRRRFSAPEREAETCGEIARLLRAAGDLPGATLRLREALEADPKRVGAMVALGEVLLERGDPAGAQAVLERAVELEPERSTWALLGVAYQARGDTERAAQALERAGDAVDPAQRAEALQRAGRDEEALAAWRAIGGEAGAGHSAEILFLRALAARTEGRLDDAAGWARQALAEGPCEPEALAIAGQNLDADGVWVLAERTASRLGTRQAATLWQVAARLLPPPMARAALLRSTQAHPRAEALAELARLEGGEAGAAYARAALSLDPGCGEAALQLAVLSRAPDVATALELAHDRAREGEKAALSLALGRARREQGAPAATVRAAFARALDEGATGDFAGEVHRALAELDAASGDGAAAERHLEELRISGHARPDDLRRLAELLGERGEHTRAVEILRQAGGPIGLLARALEAAGRDEELVSLLDRSAEAAGAGASSEEAAAWLRHGAQVAEERLSDPKRAAALLERAVRLAPDDAEPWVRLGRLYAGPLGDGDRAAGCFARAHAADRSRIDVLIHLADVHHARGELEPAEDYYRAAAERQSSGDSAASRAHVRLRLAQIAERKGDLPAEESALRAAAEAGSQPAAAEAWSRLATFYLRLGDPGRRAGALLAQAELEPERRAQLLREARGLVDADEAARLDEQILRLDPTDEGSRARVLNRVRGQGDDEALAVRLSEEAGHAPVAAREALWSELAQVRERLGDHDGAFDAWAAALAVAPKIDHARRLVWAASRVSRGGEAARVVEQNFPSAGGEAAALVAEALLGPGGDREAALPWIERAKAGQATQPGSATLRAIWRASGRWAELVQDIDAEATRRTGPAQTALELEAARVLEDDLGDLAGAAARYARLFHRDPSQREAGARARGLYLAVGNEPRALAVLEEELRVCGPHEVPELRVLRAELLSRRGPVELREAEAELLAALAAQPRSGLAHATLGELRLRLGHLDAALPHLIAAADAPDVDPKRAAASALAAAQHLAARGAHADAERLYQTAARLDPVDQRALLGLISLAAAKGDFARVVELQGRALTLAPDRRTRARLWLDRAKVFAEQLGRDADAYRCLKEAASNDPDLIEAAARLRKMAEGRGEWSLAADLVGRELGAATDEGERARLHAESGRLLEERMLDPEGALRHFEEACALGAPVWPDLARLYQVARRPREAAQALVQHAATLHDESRGDALLRAAELFRRSGSPDEAEALLGVLAGQSGNYAREAHSALLRLADDRGDPDALASALEERLDEERDEEARLELERRLLGVAVRLGDDHAVDRWSGEILVQAPSDSLAFVERKRLLQSRGDDPQLADLLRARAAHCGDPVEAAEWLFEAGRLSEKLDAPLRAAADYQSALDTHPDHHGALDALADLAYRQRDVTRARKLYAMLQGRPSSLAADEVWKRRGELAEAEADFEEARRAYQQAAAENPSLLSVHEALARLAVRRDDPTATYTHLKAILELLPLDAVDRITDLRQRLGDLALRVGAPVAARNYYELVIAQHPDRVSALRPLAELYAQSGEWEDCADALQRLAYLAETPLERAELTFREAEVHRLHLGDPDAANAGYLRAADLAPTHLPTLRRLAGYYLAEGDLAALREVVTEVESQGATLADAAVEAGIGLALLGDEQRALRHLGAAAPEEIAETLARVYAPHPAALDPALRVVQKALARRPPTPGKPGEGDPLRRALDRRLARDPSDHGARLALARYADLGGDATRARPHYAVLAWVDPDGGAARRLAEVGPATAIMGRDPRQYALSGAPGGAGPLRDALALLGPLVLGLTAPRAGAQSDPAWARTLGPLAAALGWPEVHAASIDASILGEPALAEPTKPPRLLLRRDLLADPPAVAFAAARALHLLRAGVPLVSSRPEEDVTALLVAAAAVFDPDLRPSSPFARAWLAELRALPLRPESLPPALLPTMRGALAAATMPGVAQQAQIFVDAERLVGNRVAYLATGDLGAALRALYPPDGDDTREARSLALARDAAIADLVGFATLIDR